MTFLDFLKNKVTLVVCILVLAGCPAPGPECIYAGDFGNIIRTKVTVDAKKEFTETGVRASAGESLYMSASGHVDLCISGYKISADHISPMVSEWQDSGYVVKEGDPLSIFAEGSYKDLSGQSFVDGKGLYMLILPEGERPDNSLFWYGVDGITNNPGTNATVSYYPNFIHMCNNGSIGSDEGNYGCINGFSGIVPDINGDGDIYDNPVSGKVWFRYARKASVVGTSSTGNDNERYSPWRGEYKWHGVQCPTCIAALAMPCIGGVTCAAKAAAISVACAALNRWPDGDNCREVSSGDNLKDRDHWVCDNYDDNSNGISEPYVDASGISNGASCQDNSEKGYDIVIGTGCPGVNGRYLEAHFVANETQLRYSDPEIAYKEDGITPVTDFDGNVLETRKVIAISGAPYVNMDPAQNPHVTKSGKYVNCDQNSADANSISSSSCKVPATGDIWMRLVDREPMPPGEGPTYEDNVGNYKVSIETIKVGESFSQFAQKLIDPMISLFYGECEAEGFKTVTNEYQCPQGMWTPGVIKRLYNGALRDSSGNSTQLVIAIRAAMVLYVIIIAFLFMIGASSIDQKTFVISSIKLAIIQQLISPNSWDFFSTNFFPIFTDGINEFIAIMTGDLTGVVSSQMVDPSTGEAILDVNGNPIYVTPRNPLAFADRLMSMFFSMNTLFKMSSLVFISFPIGLFYFLLVIVGMVMYIFGLVKALVLYIMAYIALALLISLTPVFLTFILFKRTRALFDEWIKMLIGFMLQPILVFTGLAIFTIFVYSMIYDILNFDVCWDWVHWAKISLPGGIDIKFLKYYVPALGHKGLVSLPISFFMIVMYLIMTEIFFKMVDWMADMGATIATGAQSTSLNAITKAQVDKFKSLASGGASGAMEAAKFTAKKAAGQFAKSGGKGDADKLKEKTNRTSSPNKASSNKPNTAVGIKKD